MKRMMFKFTATLILLFTLFSIGARAQGKFIYTNNNRENHNSVSGFKVNPDGSINLLPGMPVPTGGGGGTVFKSRIAFDEIVATAKGPYLFASNAEEETITSYRINPVTGELTFIDKADIGGGNLVDEIPLAVTPNEQYLYAGNPNHDRIHALRINDDGTLTEIETEQLGEAQNAFGLRVTSDGRFLAAQIFFGENVDLEGRIAMFSIAANGEITPVPGSPFKGSSAGRLDQGVFNCDGSLFFVTKVLVNKLTLDVFNVAPNGALSLVDGAPFTFPNYQQGSTLAISPSGKFLYVASSYFDEGIVNVIHVLRIKSGGQLEVINFSPFPTSSNDHFISSLTVDGTGKYLYVTYDQQRVESLVIEQDGSPTIVAGGFGGTNEDAQNHSSLSSLVAFPILKLCQIKVPDDITVNNAQFMCGNDIDYPPITTCGNDCGEVTCKPPSGTFFPVGTTTVTCSAKGAVDATFTVTINDIDAPKINCPADIMVSTEANKCSAKVNYTFSVTDFCDANPKIEVDFPSGTEFPKGTTTVHIKATDQAGNFSNCVFNVKVVDAQAPAINCQADITVNNEPNKCSAIVNYPLPNASDNCPGVGAPICNPPSGTAFSIGTTMVTCSVKDASDNQGQCSFKVTVKDIQPPSINCPADVTLITPNPCDAGTTVNYPAPQVSDNCPNNLAVVCNPPSGGFLPVGTTTVICTVTDGGGNQAQCSFKVTVFDVRLQDDSDPNTVLLFNSFTGDYRLCSPNLPQAVTGKGTIMKVGCTSTLTHNGLDRKLLAKADPAVKKGSASLQMPPGTLKASLTDKDISNNTSMCQ